MECQASRKSMIKDCSHDVNKTLITTKNYPSAENPFLNTEKPQSWLDLGKWHK